MTQCAMCKRELDQESDLLSLDCGGDCWGCMGEIEALMGYADSVKKVCHEIHSGIRKPISGLECP